MGHLYSDHAELYDIAFDWDVSEEVEWLLERLGAGCRSVLEPGCGSGRMLAALGARGVEAFGIDSSPAMLAAARARGVEAILADMTDFDLGRTFDGAVCPINTLLHLSPEELARHLECMARHLEPGARYLVQVALDDPQAPELHESRWEAERGGVRLRIVWSTAEQDFARGIARQRSRIEVVGGQVVEEEHVMTLWTPESWRAVVAASPFEHVATYDGNVPGRPPVGAGATGGLLWHELVLSSR